MPHNKLIVHPVEGQKDTFVQGTEGAFASGQTISAEMIAVLRKHMPVEVKPAEPLPVGYKANTGGK